MNGPHVSAAARDRRKKVLRSENRNHVNQEAILESGWAGFSYQI